jgi:hypothetical protein
MKLEIIFSSAVLTILIVMLIMATGYKPKARLFPLVIIISSIVLFGILTVKEILKTLRQRDVLTEKKTVGNPILSRYFRAPVWIGTLMLFIYLLGHMVGASLFSLLYLKFHGEKWVTTILFAMGVMAFIYGCFQVALAIPLYEGRLFR